MIKKEIYDLFIEYLVPIMDDLEHPKLIEEQKQNMDASSYEENVNQEFKIPSIEKTIDRNAKTEKWPTSIKESLN